MSGGATGCSNACRSGLCTCPCSLELFAAQWAVRSGFLGFDLCGFESIAQHQPDMYRLKSCLRNDIVAGRQVMLSTY